MKVLQSLIAIFQLLQASHPAVTLEETQTTVNSPGRY
jgi:hypothetical protein